MFVIIPEETSPWRGKCLMLLISSVSPDALWIFVLLKILNKLVADCKSLHSVSHKIPPAGTECRYYVTADLLVQLNVACYFFLIAHWNVSSFPLISFCWMFLIPISTGNFHIINFFLNLFWVYKPFLHL